MKPEIETLLLRGTAELSRGALLRAASGDLGKESLRLRELACEIQRRFRRLWPLSGSSDGERAPAPAARRGRHVAVFSLDEGTARLRGQLAEAGYTTSGGYIQEIVQGTFDLQQFVERLQPHAVVCETEKPFTCALETRDHVRRVAGNRDVPFVFLTPEPRDLLLVLSRYAAIDEMVLGEPYDVDVVVRMLELLLPDPAA